MVTPKTQPQTAFATPVFHRRAASPYSARQFVADGRRVLTIVASPPETAPQFVECLDGQLISVDTGLLLEAVNERSAALSIFRGTYGDQKGPDRLSRFCAVLEFLNRQSSSVTHAGLAYGRAPMKVYREFVEFLLNYSDVPKHREIPEMALTHFLDEWGHRWI